MTNATDSLAEMAKGPSGEGWNFNVLLIQGTFFHAARHVASPRLVLPFLYMAFGAPTVFAGLLAPVVQIAQLASQIVVAPIIRASRTRKWHLMLCAIAMATALSALALPSSATPEFA